MITTNKSTRSNPQLRRHSLVSSISSELDSDAEPTHQPDLRRYVHDVVIVLLPGFICVVEPVYLPWVRSRDAVVPRGTG